MSVKIRPYRRGGWEVDVRAVLADGSELRERRKAPVASKSGALRWAQARERVLLTQGRPAIKPAAPLLAVFAQQFLDGQALADRQKPSAVAAKQTILRLHLIPHLGVKRLDDIRTSDVQRLKSELVELAPKTVNNVLSVLSSLLKTALEWGVIESKPCSIRLLKTARAEAAFHDFEQYQLLVEEARRCEPRSHLAVLLGGDAGLRAGEILALDWSDVDFARGRLLIQRSDWEGRVTLPKGGRMRRVPMTRRLAEALEAHRHLKGTRVLCQPSGKPLTRRMLQTLVWNPARRAKLENEGIHVLRHTFCSHLAMRGAPARAIQELAGHRDLSTTQRYMHLSPAAVDAAIRLLEAPTGAEFGDMLETAPPRIPNRG